LRKREGFEKVNLKYLLFKDVDLKNSIYKLAQYL